MLLVPSAVLRGPLHLVSPPVPDVVAPARPIIGCVTMVVKILMKQALAVSQKIFLMGAFLALPQLTYADTTTFFNLLDSRYMISDSSLLIYRSGLPKDDQKKFVITDDLKKKTKLLMAENFKITLEKQFTKDEISYFEKLYSHPSMLKFDNFLRSYIQYTSIEVIEKNKSKLTEADLKKK